MVSDLQLHLDNILKFGGDRPEFQIVVRRLRTSLLFLDVDGGQNLVLYHLKLVAKWAEGNSELKRALELFKQCIQIFLVGL
jgi:hypothetical protein